MKIQNFEEFLEEQFFREEPTVLDDDFPDAFNDWKENMDIEDIIERGNKYGEFLLKEFHKLIKQKICKCKISQLTGATTE